MSNEKVSVCTVEIYAFSWVEVTFLNTCGEAALTMCMATRHYYPYYPQDMSSSYLYVLQCMYLFSLLGVCFESAWS